ncbi:MAG: ATP-binding protein [Helicobacteraceae bacterium]|nr:ATP-binding protein [Helicobacteraceae bacterium]
MNPFSKAKNIFLEKVNNMDYIDLDINISARHRIEQLISQVPFQIVILTGRPGVGKSYLIKQLENSIPKETLHIQLFPFLSLNGFLAQLHLKFLPHIPINKNMTRDEFFKSFSDNLPRNELSPTIIIDEVQLYGDKELEVIRMLSDCRVFRFILVTHALKQKEVLNESYFTSRIWDKIIINQLDLKNVRLFIIQKLDKAGLASIPRLIKDSGYKFIYKQTEGNLRLLTRMCFLLFDICEYYYNIEPTIFSKGEIPKKYIQMAAIELGSLDAR